MSIIAGRVIWNDGRGPAIMFDGMPTGRCDGQSIHFVERVISYNKSIVYYYRNFQIDEMCGRFYISPKNIHNDYGKIRFVLYMANALSDALDFVDKYLLHFNYTSAYPHGERIGASIVDTYMWVKFKRIL